MAKRIQQYEIGKVIGKGDMSIVSLASLIRTNQLGEERKDPTPLAFKELQKDYALNASYRNRFLEEVTAYKQLNLPNAVEVLDVVMDQNTLAVVMPYYEGKLLSDYIPKEGLPLIEVLDIMEPVADVIDALHFNGLVHGNLQPKNVMLAKRGMVPIVLDAGIFKNAFWMGCIQFSQYRAPEDLVAKKLSPMSDIYAFAAMIYEMLSGQLPWNRKLKEDEILQIKQTQRLDPISIYVPDISVKLLGGLMDCLSPELTDRRPRCMDLINLMRVALDEDEQTAEFANIDPKVLLEAQQRVAELDKELVKLEEKIRVKQDKVQAEYERLGQSINAEKAKVEALTTPDTPTPDAKSAPSGWGRFLSFLKPSTSGASKRKGKSVSPEKLEAAQEKMRQNIEGLKQKYLDLETKIKEELVELQTDENAIKKELRQYGEIHPSLLGFRAVKPFSVARLKIGKVRQQMILIPKGNFVMGAPPTDSMAEEDERTQHNVILSQPFWVANTPVTQMLYRAILGKNPSKFKNEDSPVEMVNWFDAIQFCNALSQRENLMPCYEVKSEEDEDVRWNRQANGYRLLTEAEWEYVARAGGPQLFAGSSTALDVAWFSSNSTGSTHSVKKLSPNLWGLYDLNGNVWEWCWDWFGEYSDGNATDPIGPKLGRGRIFRGGSWAVPEKMVRNTQRGAERPHNRMPGLGFRIARNIGR
jgi:formylglycine-generating enzyme required for sulfatase activity/tRNA A-37 threonylcarbamoyl transferase component Bud32